MINSDLNNLVCGISSLSIFRGLLAKKEMSSFLAFLKCDGCECEKVRLYGEFVYSLAASDYSFSDFLKKAVYEDENAYVMAAAKKKQPSPVIAANTKAELNLFSALTKLSANELLTGYTGYIPQFENHFTDFEKLYFERMEHLEIYGYGIFAQAGMFKVEEKRIVPVESADDITVDSFIGYDKQRNKVMDNTRALIEGRPAANVLLCGDAGTGKSSTVKACANYFYDRGLRLIELRKDRLFSLPYVMGRIADNPLKFIIFIDDLSFNKNDDCFSMLKAALEGSASAKAQNAVIYATSNRRHIVKESFSDRSASDDVHHSDTMQELMSLSDRFGLTVYYEKPSKTLYLDIVHRLAERYGINMHVDDVDIKAEAFALSKGSRSPRAAEQFVKSLIK